MTNLLTAKNLSVRIGGSNIVNRASFFLKRGETTALIGESGSGKTLLSKALINMLPAGSDVDGKIYWNGSLVDDAQRVVLRGKDIAFIFQEPLSSLNPALKIGIQLTEGPAQHTDLSTKEIKENALKMLEKVKIADPLSVVELYPHELSGGMRQRVMIAAALLMKPALLIADEPTTALDMVVRDEILGLMTELATEMGSAVLVISHDLGAVARVADHIMVMEKGSLVEIGPKEVLLTKPEHPYTQKLWAAIPQPQTDRLEHCVKTHPLISVRNLEVRFIKNGFMPWKRTEHKALNSINFDIHSGETLALIGESGSGKTTTARAIAGLQKVADGSIEFNGAYRNAADYARSGKLQYIFQDPSGALNPRFRVMTSLMESLLPLRLAKAERLERIQDALSQVSLSKDILGRFPHQLSGGQRQRVCIARAIVPRPDLIIADEPVSALDVTIQKQVLDLFLKLKDELGFACLFISHDLGVVEHLADRVGVLLHGELVEVGGTSQVFNAPRHSYTRKLLAATPYLERSNAGYKLVRRYKAA